MKWTLYLNSESCDYCHHRVPVELSEPRTKPRVTCVCRRNRAISLPVVATHRQLVAAMCFWSCMSRLSYEYTTTKHPSILPASSTHILYMHIRTEEPTHRHIKNTWTHKFMLAFSCMYKCTRPRTLTQQAALRLACRSSWCGVQSFFLTQPSLVRFFAKASASPAGCIQAAVTVQRFRGLWAKGWTQGSLKEEDWFQLGGGGRGCILLNPLCSSFTLQTLGGTVDRKDPRATPKPLLTACFYIRTKDTFMSHSTATNTEMSICRIMNVWRVEAPFYLTKKKINLWQS